MVCKKAVKSFERPLFPKIEIQLRCLVISPKVDSMALLLFLALDSTAIPGLSRLVG